jgi:hypothetical protein
MRKRVDDGAKSECRAVMVRIGAETIVLWRKPADLLLVTSAIMHGELLSGRQSK